MPVPVEIIETEKKDVNGEKKEFDVQKTKIESASKAILETLNLKSAAGVSRALNWCISRSGSEGGDKLNFSIKQTTDWLKRPLNNLIMEGDLSAGFDYLKANFVSNNTHKKLLEELSKFNKIHNNEEEKENTQSIGLSPK